MYFAYGQRETDHLTRKDPQLGEIIRRVGPIQREVDPDLFSAVVHQILGQQISNKALATVWQRVRDRLGEVTPATVSAAGPEALQSCGMSRRKAEYIGDFAARVLDGRFDPEAVRQMPDQEAIAALTGLRGIGVWTAEMILLFCLQRPDILSFDDLAIQRGLRMVYHHRAIDRKKFERYRRRYSPYGSVASLYLWAAAGGAVEGLRDPAPKKPAKPKEK